MVCMASRPSAEMSSGDAAFLIGSDLSSGGVEKVQSERMTVEVAASSGFSQRQWLKACKGGGGRLIAASSLLSRPTNGS